MDCLIINEKKEREYAKNQPMITKPLKYKVKDF